MDLLIKHKIDCPQCEGGEAELRVLPMVHKGKETIRFSYKCDACGFQFTTTGIDELNLFAMRLAEKSEHIVV